MLPTQDGDSAQPQRQRLAIGVDVRTRDFAVETCLTLVAGCACDADIAVQLLFLYCDDEELRRRYTGDPTPSSALGADRPLIDGIARERQILSPLRSRADLTIDTTCRQSRRTEAHAAGPPGVDGADRPAWSVTSFSFRSGCRATPTSVFDVRFLANPVLSSRN